jgi:hypothetical protein
MPETSDRPTGPGNSPRNPGFFDRIGMFESRFAFVRSLSVVTLLSSAVVGYFQYLNAYQEKVSIQAKEDMKSAADTFDSISTAFSDGLALQNILFSSFTSAVRNKSDASATALGTKNAKDTSAAYEKARTELREKIDVLAQKAEVYIDWASDIDRDPAGKRNVEDDPLSLSLLRDYRFNCSDSVNFPKFGNVNASPGRPATSVTDDKFCATERNQDIDDDTTPPNAFIRICPANGSGVARRVYWYSAKHHILTMHYCFESLHDRLEAARQWASQSDRDTTRESEIVAQTAQLSAAVDDLARRLNSFNSLALYQMERIRVKYRPAGFVCSVPIMRNFFAKSCFPLRTTTELLPQSIKVASAMRSPPPPRDQLVMSSRYPSESR